MNYATFRPQIKSGDLLAWSTHQAKGFRRFVNNLIRVFTMSEFSHVGIAWVIGDRVFVIEAVSPTVRIFPLSKKVPFYHIDMGLNIDDDHVNYLLSRVGESYSILQAIQAYFGKPKEDKVWQCAELCTSFYRKSGLAIKNSWTPSALVEAILSFDEQKQLTFIAK